MYDLVNMSKVGQMPIEYDSSKITITVEKGGTFGNQTVTVKGTQGELTQSINKGVTISATDGKVEVTRKNDEISSKGFHGLYRTLIANMIQGVNDGYEKKLEIHGVGYRGAQKGEGIELNLGFSHQVNFEPPADVKVAMADQNTIVVTGIDKQRVGQVAAEIRALRKPEPYKGKGIRYAGEQIRRKSGKANITTE